MRLTSRGSLEAEIEVRPGRPTVFLGLNATLKSVVARSLGGWPPTLRDVGSDFDVEPELNSDEWIMELIPDYRLVLRQALRVDEARKRIQDHLEDLASRHENEREAIDRTLGDFSQVVDVLHPLCLRYLEAKKKASSRLQARLIDKLYEKTRELAEKVGVLKAEDILPLDVEIFREPGEGGWVRVRDERVRRDIRTDCVSSAFAAILTLKHIINVLADISHDKKLIVMEEPEEASTPIQQVLFSRFVEEALEEEGIGEVYLVITTHSPFVAYSFSSPSIYYFYYDYEAKKFKAVEEKVGKPFMMADLAMLKLIEERAGESR